MSGEHIDVTLDQLSPLSSLAAVAPHDLVRWNGIIAEVIDVANLGPHHEQVVLQRLDRRALPISMPMADLTGAEVWHFAGMLH
jgi:hypothetical protein